MLKSTNLTWAGLLGVIVLYLSLSQFYNLAIPLSKGPDELTHYNYALFVAQNKRLPITPAEREATGTRAYLPPLYHLPVGVVMAATERSYSPGVDTSGLSPPLRVTWEPPRRQLVDIVLPRATLVRSLDERPPYWGAYRAWALGRLVSAVLGVGTIVLTFLTARSLVPHRPGLALTAAALLAFMPTYLFIAAVLNDDNMVGLVMAAYLLLLVNFLRGNRSIWLLGSMGLLIGLGVVTKYNTGLVVIGTTVLVVIVASEQGWSRRDQLLRIGLVWAAMLFSSSWWFVWNIVYFNEVESLGPVAGLLKPFAPDVDPTAYRVVNFFNRSVPEVSAFATGIQGNFWDWLQRTFETSWAITVYGVPPYPGYWFIIGALALLCTLSLAGVVLSFRRGDTFQRRWIFAFGLHFLLVLPLPLVRFFLTYRINDSAQGRHLLYPAVSVVVILLVKGWDTWLKPAARRKTAFFGGGALLAWAVFHGWYLWYAYPPPIPVRQTPGHQLDVAQSVQIDFQNGLQLTGFQVKPSGDYSVLQVDLLWRSLDLSQIDYITELTLLDSGGQPALRWLSQPAAGRFPTRAWDPGDSVRDRLHIPLMGLPPGEYELALRLLGKTGQSFVSTTEQRVTLTTLELLSQPEANTVQIWQAGRPRNDEPVFRYRATVPVTGPAAAEVSVIDSAGAELLPVTTEGNLRLWLIDHTWPGGLYRLQRDGVETNLSFWVENFDWDFDPPPMQHIVNANFNNEVMLLGYDLPIRRVQPGGGIPLILYWQSLRQMQTNYVIFDRLVDSQGQAWGGYDRHPREIYPTSLWVPGEVVDDGFAVPVAAAAPDGVYNIVIGLYAESDPAAVSIPLLQDGQPAGQTSLTIGPVKVGGPPPEAVLEIEEVNPHYPVNLELGQPPVIRLRGYDLDKNKAAIDVTFYWESLAVTDTNWSIFLHLRNAAGEIVAQKDGPTGGGRYPSSLWDAGELLKDTLHLPLEGVEAGQYTLITGLYRMTDGRRLAVPGQQSSELFLTEIDVNQ